MSTLGLGIVVFSCIACTAMLTVGEILVGGYRPVSSKERFKFTLLIAVVAFAFLAFVTGTRQRPFPFGTPTAIVLTTSIMARYGILAWEEHRHGRRCLAV